MVSRGSHSVKKDNLFQECDFPSLVCVCVFVTVTKCEGFFDFFTFILFFLQKQKTQGHVSGAHFFECFCLFLSVLDTFLSVFAFF